MTTEKHGRTPSDLVAAMPKWIIAGALVVIAGSFLYILIVQPPRIEYFGVGFGRPGAGPVEGTAGLPSSAVVAFDGECPDNWIRFEEASARFLIGAATEAELDSGPAAFRRGDNGAPLSPRAPGEPGGTEMVRLESEEMPRHSHVFSGLDMEMGGRGEGTRRNVAAVGDPGNRGTLVLEGTISEAGDSQPHYNMPPYIALHFCSRSG